jgi:excisionase family DNA binding protein
VTDLRLLFAPDLVEAIERLVDERVAAALEAVQANGSKRWLSVRQAGEFLGCSERAVYRRIETGRIPAETVRHSGRRVYIDRKALDRALERGA